MLFTLSFTPCWQRNCNRIAMKKVRIKEDAWIAKIAARKLGFTYIAMVVGRTIYLHNTPLHRFLNNKRWVIHELKHVEQYEEHGLLGFLFKYFLDYIRNGYYQNKFEVEARLAETDERLLHKYGISVNVI